VQEGLPREGGARSGEAGGSGAAGGDAMVPGAAVETVAADRAAAGGRAPTSAAGGDVLSGSATRPAIHHRLFTWRNAILGGIGAFALLGLAVAGYFVMRVTGIGPVASLAAQGVIEPGEPIIIAEFENTSSDPSLGSVVTEALRVDLTGSPALTPLAPARIQEMLRLMQRSPDERLSPALAREVAIREGVRAVLEGEVASAGSGFIVLATIRSPESQAALATFRRTARSPDEVIDAIDKLSQDIREKVGESLKSIRAAPPLARVTTSRSRRSGSTWKPSALTDPAMSGAHSCWPGRPWLWTARSRWRTARSPRSSGTSAVASRLQRRWRRRPGRTS